MNWNDPARRVALLRDDIRRLRARAERCGAPETAAALEEALSRSEREVAAARESAPAAPSAD